MKPLLYFVLAIALGCSLCGGSEKEPTAGVPYVDSKAIKERFGEVTAQDVEMLRQKKILLGSRSFGPLIVKGFAQLAKEDKKYEFPDSYQWFDVARAGGDLNVVPPDAFTKLSFVHVGTTYWPRSKCVDEMDQLVRKGPHNFGNTLDAVIILYDSMIQPELFDYYSKKMDALQADFPKVRFIYVTAGFCGARQAAMNEKSHLSSEKVRAKYMGKAPLYDMGKILSDDFRCGHAFCPEYSNDPADMHPNLPIGEMMIAKGMLLLLRDTFRENAAAPATIVLNVPAQSNAGAAAEVLPADNPDAKAVRAILDANGLKKKTVEGISVVEHGRIVELFLQEAGIAELTDEIGTLTALRKLHLYGDRNSGLPLLQKIPPAIGKCVDLEELLLNQNDLATLPVEITNLRKLRNLSIADNHLRDLPPAVVEWARHFDSKGLSDQNQTGKVK